MPDQHRPPAGRVAAVEVEGEVDDPRRTEEAGVEDRLVAAVQVLVIL